MSTYINPLVKSKIESMDIDETKMKILEELVEIEASYGTDSKVKEIKVKNCREAIIKRMPR